VKDVSEESPQLHDGVPAGDTTVIDLGEPTRWLPLAEDRSPNAWVCPFLRAIDEDGGLVSPVEAPDPTNRCAALADPVPQSLRQQELVCLTTGHVNCPRYLRGAVDVVGVPYAVALPAVASVPRAVSSIRSLSPATGGSLVLLAAAFVLSVAFVVANGGIVLRAAPSLPPAGNVLGEAETPVPTAVVTPAPTPTPSPIPTPTATPIPTPIPTPTAAPTPTPPPRSARYDLLTQCPDAPNCWIYVVRSGDNLSSIARYFGVPLKTVQNMNPWLKNGLKVGRELRIPPPTR
jgi:hypothetical protein